MLRVCPCCTGRSGAARFPVACLEDCSQYVAPCDGAGCQSGLQRNRVWGGSHGPEVDRGYCHPPRDVGRCGRQQLFEMGARPRDPRWWPHQMVWQRCTWKGAHTGCIWTLCDTPLAAELRRRVAERKRQLKGQQKGQRTTGVLCWIVHIPPDLSVLNSNCRQPFMASS